MFSMAKHPANYRLVSLAVTIQETLEEIIKNVMLPYPTGEQF